MRVRLDRPARTAQSDQAKRAATARAQLALRGLVVHDLGHDRYRVTRWGWCREVDLNGLERLAQRIGGDR